MGYCEGQGSGSSSPSHAGGAGNHNTSFKDKLLGEIPGAYTQAFSFDDFMDDDCELNEEVESLQ